MFRKTIFLLFQRDDDFPLLSLLLIVDARAHNTDV